MKFTMSRRALVATTSLVAVITTLGTGGAGVASAAPPCTPATGQQLIDDGHYADAIAEFTCVIAAQPTEADGYRGRAEADLLVGRYSDAMRDYARMTAVVLPFHPDAMTNVLAAYDARVAATPTDIPALTGASFAHWLNFQYPVALRILDDLLTADPDNAYGVLYRGSNRLLHNTNRKSGEADLERAISLAPTSADVRFIVADAYTYGAPDPERAIAEASRALAWGLDTPRVHAILATSLVAMGDVAGAAEEFDRHLDLVTTDIVAVPALAVRESVTIQLSAGRTFEIPVTAAAGQAIQIKTSSPTHEIYDSIAVLYAPDGTPVAGNDDSQRYFAGFDFIADQSGTYTVRITSFEGIWTGQLLVKRG
jgi:tetratricopeptide (TPR) repeat protein